jgi:RNA polymerase sigma factor (sigma-70 family)
MLVMQPGDQSRVASGDVAIGTAEMAEMRADFIEFYDREYPYVVRFVMQHFRDASLHAAEDAAQEAFLDAWGLTARPGKWETIADPRGWIRKVALNKYRRPPGLRRSPLVLPVPDFPETPQPGDSHADLTHEALLVLDALRNLDSELRAVMTFHLDGFTGPAIAAQLGITDQQARDLLKKARKILAANLAGITGQETRRIR